jgi:hypothetical protein
MGLAASHVLADLETPLRQQSRDNGTTYKQHNIYGDIRKFF